ncbi:DUF6894 family protein [Agrobacterium sp. Azo12]|uniref:DUF6894 family protein n=1 Tax=Agrobacterium sp. Azo12 TaxID=3031129 RepID=UPI003F8D0BD6
MPRYYLHHRRNAHTIIHDPEGAEFASLEDARLEAVAAARELLARQVIEGRVQEGQVIEIAASEGTVLMTVPFTAAVRVEKADPPCCE